MNDARHVMQILKIAHFHKKDIFIYKIQIEDANTGYKE